MEQPKNRVTIDIGADEDAQEDYVWAYLHINIKTPGIDDLERVYELERTQDCITEITADDLDGFLHVHRENAAALGATFEIAEDVEFLLSALDEKEAQGG
jgi:hypothetical protein